MCSQNTGKIAKGHTFLITIIEIRDIASEEIACHYNLIDEMTEVIKEF